jgi:hypothetical protein
MGRMPIGHRICGVWRKGGKCEGADASPNVVLMVGIDEGLTNGMDAKRAQDFVTGSADEQLREKEALGQWMFPT